MFKIICLSFKSLLAKIGNIDPYFVEELKEIKVKEGESPNLSGKIHGLPKPDVTWFHNDNEITPSEHFNFFHDPDGTISLLINNATLKDAGAYNALIKNPTGEATSKTFLTVQPNVPENSKPCFVAELKPVEVLEGESLMLKVKIDGYPKPLMKWLKDGEEITGDERISFELQPDGTGILRIFNSKPSDMGKYTAVAINKEGRTRSSAPIFIKTKLYHLPEFLRGLLDTELTSGQPGQLSVTVKGDPCPNLKWFKDGKEIMPNDRLHFKEGPNNERFLSFDNVVPEDAGNYKAIIFNKQGEKNTACKLKVNCEYN